MKKAVVCALLSAAFLILLLINTTLPQHPSNGAFTTKYNRRLGFRNANHIVINFDPLVTKMERESEERHNNNGGIELDFDMDENKAAFLDQGRLNVTLRIMILFPLLDTNPNDGFVEEKELEAWIIQQANERLDHHTKQVLKENDVDGDGSISFSEYLPRFTKQEIDLYDVSHGGAGWWMELFLNADADHNGLLSFYELRDFLHPEDSNNEKIRIWLLGTKMSQIEHNHDRRLNFVEFQSRAYDTYRHFSTYERKGSSQLLSATELFEYMDFNRDGYLDVEELKPMFDYLCPGDLSYAKHYAIYLTHAADDNGDGKLTLQEMINNESAFYDTVDDEHRYGDNEHAHDEL